MGATPVIPDEERLLHRWDPGIDSHANVDEGTGEKVISSGAFSFDGDPKGCSNYCLSVLVANGLAPRDALKRESQYLASALAGDIRAIEVDEEVNVLDIEMDPWPDAPDESFAADIAHALILTTRPVGGSRLRRIKTKLAIAFRHGDAMVPAGSSARSD
jgi:hypothetical protein